MEKPQKPINPALESHALFFNPAYMTMRLEGNGPKHFPAPRGVEADREGNVTFHFHAPDAHSVEVAELGGIYGSNRIPMERREDGDWSVTVPHVQPGFHYHHYYVDGNRVTNPQAPYGYGSHEAINYFEVFDPDDDMWLCRDVPHGTIHMELYNSSKTGMMQAVWVYTPPSYRTDESRHYPVLYLHHGGGENETGWIWQGKINYIADNLIAEGLCEEMIIVMSCLYDIDYNHPDEFLAGDFDRLLTQDCIPLIEERYRVIPEPAARAICGLSMGSYHSAQTACNHPGLFAYVGMLSGSFDQRWYGWCDCRDVIAHDPVFQRETKLFFMSVGTGEIRLYGQVGENISHLKESGIPCAYFECPGLHEWTVWRKSIQEFLKLLFR